MRHFDEIEAAEQEAKRKKGLLEKLQREKKVSSIEDGEVKKKVEAAIAADGTEDVKMEDVKMEDLEVAANGANVETNGEESRPLTPVVGSVSSFLPHCEVRIVADVFCTALASWTDRPCREDERNPSRRSSRQSRVSRNSIQFCPHKDTDEINRSQIRLLRHFLANDSLRSHLPERTLRCRSFSTQGTPA